MVKDSERGGVTSHAGASAGACSVSRMAQGLTRHAGQNGAGSGSAHGISLPDLFIYSRGKSIYEYPSGDSCSFTIHTCTQ